jgi:hypothetical protein
MEINTIHLVKLMISIFVLIHKLTFILYSVLYYTHTLYDDAYELSYCLKVLFTSNALQNMLLNSNHYMVGHHVLLPDRFNH